MLLVYFITFTRSHKTTKIMDEKKDNKVLLHKVAQHLLAESYVKKGLVRDLVIDLLIFQRNADSSGSSIFEVKNLIKKLRKLQEIGIVSVINSEIGYLITQN